MKRIISFVLAFLMIAACFAFGGCAKQEATSTIKIGM